jgi:hypothetical protein
MATVSAYILIVLAWPIATVLLLQNDNYQGTGVACASPFVGVAMTGILVSEMNGPGMVDRWWPQFAWATFWMLFFLTVAALLLKLELSRFNRKLGRTPDEGMPRRPVPGFVVAKPEPVLV